MYKLRLDFFTSYILRIFDLDFNFFFLFPLSGKSCIQKMFFMDYTGFYSEVQKIFCESKNDFLKKVFTAYSMKF